MLYILMTLPIVFIIRINVYYVLLSFNLEVDVFFTQVWFCLAVFFLCFVLFFLMSIYFVDLNFKITHIIIHKCVYIIIWGQGTE